MNTYHSLFYAVHAADIVEVTTEPGEAGARLSVRHEYDNLHVCLLPCHLPALRELVAALEAKTEKAA